MRTTVDIDEGLLRRLRETAVRSRVPIKTALNAAIRRGLDTEPRRSSAKRYRCPVFPLGQPISASFDLDKALRLASALEDTEIAREIQLGK